MIFNTALNRRNCHATDAFLALCPYQTGCPPAILSWAKMAAEGASVSPIVETTNSMCVRVISGGIESMENRLVAGGLEDTKVCL